MLEKARSSTLRSGLCSGLNDFYFELVHLALLREVTIVTSLRVRSFDNLPTCSHADRCFGDGEDFKTLAAIAIHFPLFLLLGAIVLLCQVLN